MTNTNLNNVAVDIIGVVTLWNLTHLCYNLSCVENKPPNRNITAYLGLGCFSTIASLLTFNKYK